MALFISGGLNVALRKKIKIDDKTVGYIAGNEHDPKKKNLVFIHSAGGTKDLWEDAVEHFSRGYNTIAIDLPGHGDSEGEGKSDAFAYSDFVHAVARTAGYLPAMFFGLSMGGAIAQAIALSHPGSVTGLVLCGTGAKMPVAPVIFETIRSDYGKFLDLAGVVGYGPMIEKSVIEKHRKIFASVSPEVAEGDYIACSIFDSRNRLNEISAPALILCGENDNLMPLKFSQYLEQNINGSRLVTFKRAGHFVIAEEDREFYRVVDEFLEEFEGRN